MKSCTAALLYLLTADAARCQQGESPEHSSRGCLVVELLNPAGWSIPGLANATTKISSANVKEEGVPGDVTVDVLEPTNPDSSVTLVHCLPNQPGRLEVRSQPVRVKAIWRFKRNSRPFAYKVNVGLTGGNGVALGAAEVLLFYDPDGSGQFTVQRDFAGAQPLVVPAWVVGTQVPSRRDVR